MIVSKLTSRSAHEYHFTKLKEGNEKGLAYFYHLWYPGLYYRGLKYIKDDVNAGCIVNEAFLRLWLFRKRMTTVGQIEQFIKKLTADGYRAYYQTASKRFQRNMLRLDELENYQNFIRADDPADEADPDILEQEESDEKWKLQWAQVMKVIPNLHADQQLFIQLCLKYSFDYGRIAWHIGGVSDYEVACKVEKTLLRLRAIIIDTHNLERVGQASQYRFEGDISEEQTAILRMRYELQHSFEEIAAALNLSQGYIQKAFVNAITRIKKVKI